MRKVEDNNTITHNMEKPRFMHNIYIASVAFFYYQNIRTNIGTVSALPERSTSEIVFIQITDYDISVFQLHHTI